MKRFATVAGIVAMLCAASSPAFAAFDLGGYMGPIVIQYTNYDMSAQYGSGAFGNTIAQCDALQVGSVTGSYVIPAGYEYAGEQEDGWGIFKVTSILTDNDVEQTLWVDGQDGQEIVGMFYGLVDVCVDNDLAIVLSDGYMLDLYIQDAGQYTEVNGSSARVAFNKYAGIGYDAGGNMLADAELLLESKTVPGSLDYSAYFGSTETVSHTSTMVDSYAFMDAVGGSWYDNGNIYIGRSWPEVPNSVPAGQVVADAYVTSGVVYYGTTPNETADWDYKSTDPVRLTYIPEPMTMGVLLSGAVALLGSRRRR